MYVRNRMTTDVISIFPDASLSLAFQTMVEKKLNQLPVVKDRKLLGLVTEQVLAEFSPSKATTLSIYEMNYVLAKTHVESIMLKNVPTCTPDMLVEEAAVILNDKRVNALPVVDDQGNLVGILTKSDIIAAFIEIIGTNDFGTRIALEIRDQIGTFADIGNTIKDFHVNITHVSNTFYKDDPANGEIVIRLNTLETDEIVKHLEEKGYKIVSIRKNA